MSRSLVALVVLLAVPALAADRVNKTLVGGVAVDGYDPVAYFEQAKPVKGSSDITVEWNGAIWRFASAESRRRFIADPESFAPQYGGFCAYAVSRNYTADADPHAWRIVGGKLYLNYNTKVQAEWEKDITGNVAKGDRNWPGLREKR